MKFYFGGEYGMFGKGPGCHVWPAADRERAARVPRHDRRHRAALVGVGLGRGPAGDSGARASPSSAVDICMLVSRSILVSRKPTNEELVREAAELARTVGRPIATPAEAANLLDLPGGN